MIAATLRTVQMTFAPGMIASSAGSRAVHNRLVSKTIVLSGRSAAHEAKRPRSTFSRRSLLMSAWPSPAITFIAAVNSGQRELEMPA